MIIMFLLCFSDCFLQIRDGPYGFSNLIGKYCGEEFPPEITSKERHLWLHFHSDESIEYSGFQAVYEFIDRRKDGKYEKFQIGWIYRIRFFY